VISIREKKVQYLSTEEEKRKDPGKGRKTEKQNSYNERKCQEKMSGVRKNEMAAMRKCQSVCM
jgi:hypothetical protein